MRVYKTRWIGLFNREEATKMAFEIKPIGATPSSHNFGINGFNNVGWNNGTPIFGVTNVSPAQLGKIVYDDFNRGALGADWTTVMTTMTATISGNALLLTGGGTAAATQRLRYNKYSTGLDYWKIQMAFKTTTSNTTSFGYGCGVQGINTQSPASSKTVFCSMSLVSGANVGKVVIYSQTGTSTATLMYTSASSFPISLNDELIMTVTRSKLTITCDIINVTQGTSKTESFTFDSNYPTSTSVNAGGQFAIWGFGGSATVHSYTVTSSENIGNQIIAVGDSITQYYAGNGLNAYWISQAMLYSNMPYSRNWGSGDTTQSVLDRIQEIIKCNPKYVILMIGGNDIYFGTSSGIWQSNYMSIRNQLTAYGITVIHCYATPRDTVDVTPLNLFISRTFSNMDIVIDTFTPLWSGVGTGLNAAYNSGDAGVHPNALGHSVIGATVRNYLTNIKIIN